MRYLLYSFHNSTFFAKEVEGDLWHFCDLWSSTSRDLDSYHRVHENKEDNDFGFMIWFDSPQSLEDIQQQYPELFI